MDTHEFRILSSDFFEHLDSAIGRLAVDGVEARVYGPEVSIMFDSGSEIVLARNDEFQRLTLRSAEGLTHYYFNETEEDWYAVGRETALLDDLSAALSTSAGTSLHIEIA